MRPTLPVLATLLLAACGSDAPRREDAVHRDTAKTVEVGVGETFHLGLRSNPSTGYSWGRAAALDTTVLALVDSTYTPEPGTEDRNGAGGEEVWTFRAKAAGEASVALVYRRPGSGDPTAGNATFRVVVR